MRIDAHHSYSERYPLDHLGSILKRNRFEGSVLVTEPPIPEALPDFVRGVVVRWDSGDLSALEEWRRHPRFRGVFQLAGQEDNAGFGELEKRGIPLDAGTSPLGAVRSVAERFPSLRIVMDQTGETGDLPPNVFCKMGLVSREWAQYALKAYGPGRLMFGSHWPEALPEISWKATLAAFTQAIGAQTIEVREELLGGTAARFYAL